MAPRSPVAASAVRPVKSLTSKQRTSFKSDKDIYFYRNYNDQHRKNIGATVFHPIVPKSQAELRSSQFSFRLTNVLNYM